MNSQYAVELKEFKEKLSSFFSEDDDLVVESFFEMTRDWSMFMNMEEARDWLHNFRKNPEMKVKEIAISEMEGWTLSEDKIAHSSGDFFELVGVRVRTENREKSGGWDQPLLRQVGFDGGILGIIRARFEGVPHYLLEAKEEPGNYGVMQLSPTLQATFSNIRKSHGGRKPFFTELFIDPDSQAVNKVLFDAWLSEDGGRLDRKRNRAILLELNDPGQIKIPNERFRWFSLFQIRQLMKEDALISPHVRGILSYA